MRGRCARPSSGKRKIPATDNTQSAQDADHVGAWPSKVAGAPDLLGPWRAHPKCPQPHSLGLLVINQPVGHGPRPIVACLGDPRDEAAQAHRSVRPKADHEELTRVPARGEDIRPARPLWEGRGRTFENAAEAARRTLSGREDRNGYQDCSAGFRGF